MALPPSWSGSIRKILGRGRLKTSLEYRSKKSRICSHNQNMSGQFKMCPDSWKYVRTAQNVSGEPKICLEMQYIFLEGHERWLHTIFVCSKIAEDFWMPPGRFRVFRPLINSLSKLLIKTAYIWQREAYLPKGLYKLYEGLICIEWQHRLDL